MAGFFIFPRDTLPVAERSDPIVRYRLKAFPLCTWAIKGSHWPSAYIGRQFPVPRFITSAGHQYLGKSKT